MNGNSTYFTLTSLFVGAMILFGLGLLFVNAAKIERNVLVGTCTVITSLIAAFVLRSYIGASHVFTAETMVMLIMLSLLGFGAGWLFDRLAGPRPLSSMDEREATLGADLAD